MIRDRIMISHGYCVARQRTADRLLFAAIVIGIMAILLSARRIQDSHHYPRASKVGLSGELSTLAV